MKKLYRNITLIILVFFLSAHLTPGQSNQNNLLVSLQNYPNPFNLQTQIQFVLAQNSEVSVKVFNILGREVKTLIDNKSMSAGPQIAVWDGKDNSGNVVPSGMYLYKVQAGNSVLTKKMSLLK